MADNESLEATVEDNDSLELTVNPPYVGSAYSPEVDIEETSSTITVTITDARGEHSYSVPNTESAISDAQAATTAANNAATAATSAAGSAGAATTAANNAATAANNAATNANTKAALAAEKAAVAVQAASDASSAAETAAYKASLANTAATAANAAASAAGNAASAATSAADYADTATRDASAAADAANSAASAATAAAGAAVSATATVDAAVASANSAAAYANEKGGAAANAASAANDAATLANAKAGLANDAATLANSKASAANTAAGAANDAAELANTKAGLANDAATLANQKAGLADDAATAANNAAAAATALVESYADELDNKADQDGYYEQLTAGAADNLTGRGDGVGAEYIYRTSGGTADVADGTARINVIKGNTVVWNQIALPDANILGTGASAITKDGHGKYTLGNLAGSAYLTLFDDLSTRANHKLYFAMNASKAPAGNFIIYFETTTYTHFTTFNSSNYAPRIATLPSNAAGQTTAATIGDYDGMTMEPVIVDLTEMFGAGNEPATVAEFEALYPLPYYPYNAGTLLPVNMEGVETVGFNQWDEEWESGSYDNNGNKAVSPTYIRSKNLISAFPSTAYSITKPTGKAIYVVEYGASGAFIQRTELTTAAANVTFTTTASTKYLAFCIGGAGSPSTTYNNDICINLSWSGYRNGEYEPYWEFERAIPVSDYFPDGMRSAGTAYDELQNDKAVQRIGVVDADSTWHVDSTSVNANGIGYVSFYTGGTTSGFTSNLSSNINISTSGWGDSTGREFASNGGTVFYRFPTTAPVTVENAIADMQANNAVCYYELATPTETPIDPPLNLSYKVSDFGTERIMVPTGEMTAPVPMQIVYGLNAVDTLRRLPVQYISHASMAQFIAAIESHFDVTITETYDDDNERYEYEVSDNGGGE